MFGKKVSLRQPFEAKLYFSDKKKNDQNRDFLGASLAKSNGIVFTCAHRELYYGNFNSSYSKLGN
jgi:hypothetical protein